MRARKKKNGRARLEACADLLIKDPEEMESFRKRQPWELEIGCGKGTYICLTAQQHPDRFFFAAELVTDVLITALERTKSLGIENVRFLNINATRLGEFFKDGEVKTIHLNFSDPWPKSRHAGRRLTHRNFLELYKRILANDGKILFKTDNRPLFDFSLGEFEAADLKVTDVTYDLHNSIYNEGNIQTEYEVNFSSKGYPINRAVIYK